MKAIQRPTSSLRARRRRAKQSLRLLRRPASASPRSSPRNDRVVYLVGAGPGDEALITVRGAELIKEADCIIYDYLVNPDLLRSRKDGSKLIYAGKKAGAHTLSQDNINKLLVKESKKHRKIVRLKGGDPLIFGRGAEEALYLKKHNINFEIIPGVTSAIAAAAYAGIPLTERSVTSTVGFITGHEDPAKPESGIDWEALVRALGTMVFLMGVGNLDLIVKRLIACGKPKDTPVAVIMWGTMARQKTVIGTLRDISGRCRKNRISSPAVIVVGETVNFRKDLSWFENRPLFAKRVAVTRTREQASALSGKLKDLGAEVVELPTIKIVPLGADEQLKRELTRKKYDWVFFTSQNGVHEFNAFLNRSGQDCRILGDARICAIGPETAKSLSSIGIKADYTPKEFVAEAIVEYFKRSLRGAAAARRSRSWKQTRSNLKNVIASPMARNDTCCLRALILRAKRARDILPEGLRRSGFDVKIVDLYDTVVPGESVPILKQALSEGVDIITFTSSSTVENFIKLIGRDYRRKLSGIKLASIGPVTSGTLRSYGLKADVQAKIYTIDGLVTAMTSYPQM